MIPGVWVWQLDGMLGARYLFWSLGVTVFWYCGAPSVTWYHGIPIVDFGYPKYRYLGGYGGTGNAVLMCRCMVVEMLC